MKAFPPPTLLSVLPIHQRQAKMQSVQSQIYSILNSNLQRELLCQRENIDTILRHLQALQEQYHKQYPHPICQYRYLENLLISDSLTFKEIQGIFAEVPEIQEGLLSLEKYFWNDIFLTKIAKEVFLDSLLERGERTYPQQSLWIYDETLRAIEDYIQINSYDKATYNDVKNATKISLPQADFSLLSERGYQEWIKLTSKIIDLNIIHSSFLEQPISRIIAGLKALKRVKTLNMNFNLLSKVGEEEKGIFYNFLNQIKFLTIKTLSPELFETEGEKILQQLTGLKGLILSKSETLHSSQELIALLLSSSPGLKHLGFSWDPFEEKQHLILHTIQLYAPQLKSLELDSYYKVYGQLGEFQSGFENINLPRLRFLSLDAIIIGQHTPKEIKKGLRNLPSLRHLTINDFSEFSLLVDYTNATSEGGSSIESLNLCFYDDTQYSDQKLIDFVKRFKNIRSLSISSRTTMTDKNTVKTFGSLFGETKHIPFIILPHDAFQHLAPEEGNHLREYISNAPNTIIV